MVGAGVCSADRGVEALGCHLVGAAGLLGLLGCGCGGQVVLRLFGLWCGGWFGNGSGCRRRRGGCGLAAFFIGGWVGVGAGLAVEGELAAVGDDEGLVLFGHN